MLLLKEKQYSLAHYVKKEQLLELQQTWLEIMTIKQEKQELGYVIAVILV